jgi:hypothetical protein
MTVLLEFALLIVIIKEVVLMVFVFVNKDTLDWTALSKPVLITVMKMVNAILIMGSVYVKTAFQVFLANSRIAQ